jgi:hypothetical protein
MDLQVTNAILHSLSNTGASVLSETELDIDSEACQAFIGKHVKRLLDNPAAKEATFNHDSAIYKAVCDLRDGNRYFTDVCKEIGACLSALMEKYPIIPAGDLLIVLFSKKRSKMLAILKLNYRACFTHQLVQGESGADNQLVKYEAVLPFDSGKAEEAVLIPFDPMLLKVIEKPYKLDDEEKNYFSELFLECDPAMSKKEAAEVLHNITREINDKHFDGGVDVSARVKSALMEAAEDAEGVIQIEDVAAKVFSNQLEVREEYLTLAREAGLRADVFLGEKYVNQQFGVQRIKAENGVEIKFPADLWSDSGNIEIITTPEGGRTIILKNVGKIEVK